MTAADRDAAFREAQAARLARCIHASGCDDRSHDIRCNEALYARPEGGTQ